jgi:hypothetical protein
MRVEVAVIDEGDKHLDGEVGEREADVPLRRGGKEEMSAERKWGDAGAQVAHLRRQQLGTVAKAEGGPGSGSGSIHGRQEQVPDDFGMLARRELAVKNVDEARLADEGGVLGWDR